jgi:4-amino-4-deoxy-L-arabinose transferase-like glycosyltransferase
MNSRRIILFAAAFFLFILLGNRLPITDPVESNYALTAKEMILSNDWLSPRIYGQVWFDKPIMIYWLIGAMFKILGFAELAARCIPALFGACGVVLSEWFVSKIANPQQGLITAAILGTSLQYFMISKLLIPDVVLFVFDSAALVFFFLGYFENKGRNWWYLLMYPCMALAVLTKGPVGILLPGIIIIVFIGLEKKWSELKQMHILSGLFLFSMIALPWYFLMYAKHGESFLNTFFGVHNYLRATVSEHPKDNVFYYYFVVFILSTLPWTGLAIGGLYTGFKGLGKKNAKISLLIIWAAVYFIFYSFMATKYLTYTFPMLFPVVVLASFFVEAELRRPSRRQSFLVLLPLSLFLFGTLAACYNYVEKDLLVGMTVVACLLLTFTWWNGRNNIRKTLFTGLCATIAFYIFLSATALPTIAETRSDKKNLAELLNMYYDYKIGMYGFYSTSSVFYTGQIMMKIEPQVESDKDSEQSWSAKYTMPKSNLEYFAKQFPNSIIVVPMEKRQEFEQEARGLTYELLSMSKGYIFYKL